MIKPFTIAKKRVAKNQWTRAEVREEMRVRSRTTLTTYCNYLRIPRWIRYFTADQRNQIMALRRWIEDGNAISDYVSESERQDCA
jgi:hypothetical protein